MPGRAGEGGTGQGARNAGGGAGADDRETFAQCRLPCAVQSLWRGLQQKEVTRAYDLYKIIAKYITTWQKIAKYIIPTYQSVGKAVKYFVLHWFKGLKGMLH